VGTVHPQRHLGAKPRSAKYVRETGARLSCAVARFGHGICRGEAGLGIHRLKYKTKDGDRQTSQSYLISLFP